MVKRSSIPIHVSFIFSMLVLKNGTSHAKRRSWLGPASLLQFQNLPTSRDSFGFISAGGKIYLYAGLANELGMDAVHIENFMMVAQTAIVAQTS